MPLQKQCAHLFVRGRTSSVLYFSLAPEPDLSKMAKALSLSVCSSIHSTPPSHLDLLLYYRFHIDFGMHHSVGMELHY